MENSINFSPKKDPRDSLFAKKKKELKLSEWKIIKKGKQRTTTTTTGLSEKFQHYTETPTQDRKKKEQHNWIQEIK